MNKINKIAKINYNYVKNEQELYEKYAEQLRFIKTQRNSNNISFSNNKFTFVNEEYGKNQGLLIRSDFNNILENKKKERNKDI